MKKAAVLLMLFCMTNQAFAEFNENKIRYGANFALTMSKANVVYSDVNNKFGTGAQGGLAMRIPYGKNRTLTTGLNVLYRSLETVDEIDLKTVETALSIPALFKWDLLKLESIESTVYFNAGFTLDIPLSTKVKYRGSTEDYADFHGNNRERTPLDFGTLFGVGMCITGDIEVYWNIFGFSWNEFDKRIKSAYIYQTGIGVNYFF